MLAFEDSIAACFLFKFLWKAQAEELVVVS